MKKIVRIVAIIIMMSIVSTFTGVVYASEGENGITLQTFLETNGVNISESMELYIVTNIDDTQHIEVVEHLNNGDIEVNMISCIDETDDDITNIKIFPEAKAGSTIEIPMNVSTCASTPMNETIGSTGLTVTITAYYTVKYISGNDGYLGNVYAPSGVTGKITRSSGSNVASNLYGFFALKGDLYQVSGSNGSLIQTNYSYSVDFTQNAPNLNVVYSAYKSLASERYIHPYANNTVTSASGLGYSAVINGKSYEYAVAFK